eukprot:gene16680-19824_t
MSVRVKNKHQAKFDEFLENYTHFDTSILPIKKVSDALPMTFNTKSLEVRELQIGSCCPRAFSSYFEQFQCDKKRSSSRTVRKNQSKVLVDFIVYKFSKDNLPPLLDHYWKEIVLMTETSSHSANVFKIAYSKAVFKVNVDTELCYVDLVIDVFTGMPSPDGKEIVFGI